ncbi:hypothetical protein EDD37DRAFT_14908 [Exophiala viscosa]|uniref:6-phosphogluconate dehydrogenase NADP-binding domain-containing protein n=1 Tax=Exophiala viscosa TaxID=2486360 RepID=A0AAN6DR79_9EURO|nr:hypothetical protein EDD36DRAFT_329506 [Exophiala viscosa]KAI1628634.1 hypothetical protein EDD37DRAFT_14908 [Exophiala viscosa]
MATYHEQFSVSVLGMGSMGSAIARVFLKHGWRTTIWNRTTSKTVPLVELGASAASSAAECIAASKLIILLLTDTEAFQHVAKGLEPSSCRGRVLLDYMTATASQVSETQRTAREILGFDAYVHGAIMTMPPFVEDPTAMIFYSGDNKAYTEEDQTDGAAGMASAVKLIGKAIWIDDDPASSALQDVMVLTHWYTFASGFLQTAALLKKTKQFKPHSKSMQRFWADFVRPFYDALFMQFEDVARQIDEEDYVSRGDGALINLHLHAIESLIKAYEDKNISVALLTPMRDLFAKAVTNGHGDEEIGGILPLL